VVAVSFDAKAKELRRVAERLITSAKRLGSAAQTPVSQLSADERAKRLHVKRSLATFLPRYGVSKDGEKVDLIDKVVHDLGVRFAERPGGYTRIIKMGPRRGDGASMSIIELLGAPEFEAGEEEELVQASAAADEASADEASADEASADEASADEASADEASADEASADEAGTDDA
jgi:large subunit ribosomal protein L17